MRDLEIRGAGELLGAEQSGHVAAVGFELYVELLNEAVAELSGRRRTAARPVRVDARVDAYVPAAYIGSEALKIDLHRRLALTEDEDELRELRASVEDRYGELPEPVENLFAIQEAKLKLAASAPTTSSSAADGSRRPADPRLGRAARAPRARPRPPSTPPASTRSTLRQDDFREALGLVDALLEAEAGGVRGAAAARSRCVRRSRAAAARRPPSVPPGAIAVVGGTDDHPRRVSTRELARVRRAYAARGTGASPRAGTTAYAQLRAAAVRLLVERAQLEQEARGSASRSTTPRSTPRLQAPEATPRSAETRRAIARGSGAPV